MRRTPDIRLDNADAGNPAARIDAASFRNVQTTPQGFLRMPIHATRVGVFTYRNPDGSVRRELRHPDDVFAPESLKTLAGIPIVDDHPNVKNPEVMLITPENTKDHIIGYTGDNIEKDGEFVGGYATIYDLEAIKKIRSGKEELSCGYQCEREEIPGVWNGLAYDIRQRNIVYNHLALVDKGRAGPNVKLRLDSADAVQVDFINPEDVPMLVKIKINGVEYEVPKAVADAYEANQSEIANAKKAADDAKASIDAEKSRADKAEARADGLQSDLTKTKADLAARNDASDDKKIREAARKTMKIFYAANATLKKETLDKMDAMSDLDIMREVIKADSPDLDLTGKSDVYIEARFDMVDEKITKTGKQATQNGRSVVDNRNDSGSDDNTAEAARKRQEEDARNAWKVAK